MRSPEWLKPGLYGAACGAIALAVIGFSWGGWMTGATAEKMAADHARLQVVAALVPICIEQSNQDPQMQEKLTEMKAAQSFQRREIIIKAGWATMPGATDPDRQVATACVEKLATLF